ncbi:MAG: TetR/AcrR family transcriptional regulator [Cyclobacteriaceae bacterium]
MADKKAEILAAARELFNRQGYPKTSVDDISQAVGMRKSSLYYYFKNKEQIFLDAFKEEWRSNLNRFVTEASKQRDPTQRILSYIRASLKHYDDTVIKHNIPVKVLVETRNLFRISMNEVNQDRIKFYKSCINEGIEKGLYKPCDSDRVAHTLMTVKFSIQFDYFNQFLHSTPDKSDFQHIKEEILFAVGLMLDGLKI